MKTFSSFLASLIIVVLTLKTECNAQWQQTNGPPYGGSVYCFANNGTHLFVETSGGGVFLSTDNGTSWNAMNSGLTNMYIRAFTVSPNGAGASNLFLTYHVYRLRT